MEEVPHRFSTVKALLLTAFSALGSMNYGISMGSLNTTSSIYRQLFEWCGNDYEFECDTAKSKWAYVNSIIFLSAAIVSQLGGGMLKRGRRYVFYVMDICFIVGPIFGIVSPNHPSWSFVLLLIGRFITGIGLGLSAIVCSLYVAESVPHEIRGLCGFALQIMPPLAAVINMSLGMPQEQPDKHDPLPPGDFEKWWWQFLLALPIFFAVAQIILLAVVFKYEPAQVTIAALDRNSCELPVEQCPIQQAALKHIKLVYHPDDAMMVLEDLKGARLENLDKEEADAAALALATPSTRSVRLAAVEKKKLKHLSLLEIVRHPTHLYVLLIGVLLGFSRQMGMFNVFYTKSNTLMEQAGVDSEDVTLISLLSSCFALVSAVCMAPNVEKFGRRSLILFANIATAVLFAPTAVCYWFEGSLGETTTSYMAIATMILSSAVFQASLGPLMFIYISEVHHPATKNASVGFVNCFNWLLTVVVVFGSAYVSVPVVYNIGFFAMTILSILTYLYLKETAGLGGRSPYYPDLLVSSSRSQMSSPVRSAKPREGNKLGLSDSESDYCGELEPETASPTPASVFQGVVSLTAVEEDEERSGLQKKRTLPVAIEAEDDEAEEFEVSHWMAKEVVQDTLKVVINA